MRLVGVDEAGRGSFVGPLVVGGFAYAGDRVDEVRAAGARDSKELTAAAREAVYGRLCRIGGVASVALSPATVDRAVHRGRLNDLEAHAFGDVIRRLGAEEARVDACDPDEARFGRRVALRAGDGIRIVARHHADRDDPLVGAASIIAKVRRDRALARLRAELGDGIGSGYPSDLRTVEFVRAHFRLTSETPSWLRASWATMTRVMPSPPAVTLEQFLP